MKTLKWVVRKVGGLKILINPCLFALCAAFLTAIGVGIWSFPRRHEPRLSFETAFYYIPAAVFLTISAVLVISHIRNGRPNNTGF